LVSIYPELYCACLHDQDKRWYRGVIKAMDSGLKSAKVYFVDWGNT
jgi:hypothetical protein